jgi:uncharacterized repeat protein (TIGR01451 family)
MKKIFTFLSALLACCFSHGQITSIPLSDSYNVFSVVGVRTQLWADPQLNTLSFIHRDAVTGNTLLYDISTDQGQSWTLDKGPLYTSQTQRPRYPQCAVANPSGSLVADSFYVSFQAAFSDSINWSGIVQGSQQFVTGSTPSVEADSVNALHHEISTGYLITPQGVIWSVEGAMISLVYNDELIVTKGTWNTASRKFDYTTQILSAPMINDGEARFTECSIAFSQDGLKGYIVVQGNNGSITDSVYHPIIFRTSNGGQTWTGPSSIALNGIDSLLNLGSSKYTMFPEMDMAVDVNGTLHLFCSVLLNGDPWTGFVQHGLFGLFDITYNGTTSNAYLVALPQTFIGNFGTGTQTDPLVREYNRPQLSMNSAGTKLFFTWLDTDTLTFGTTDNIFSDFYARGYDVTSGLWTNAVNFTYGTMFDGASVFNNVSSYCFSSGGTYKIPLVITQMFGTSFTGQPVTYAYADGVTFTDAQFNATNNGTGLAASSIYSISGQVFFDSNGNGVMDGAEGYLSGQRINLQPDGVTMYTSANGFYDFHSWFTSSTHVITTNLYPYWAVTTDSLSYTVLEDTVDQTGFDFGINATTAYNNLEVSVAGAIPRCNGIVPHWITYQNVGTTILDGRIKLVMDNLTTFVNSVPTPDAVSADTLFFNFTNLPPFESRHILVYLQMPPNAGDTLHFAAFAEFDSSGTYYVLGENALQEIVRCSFDPNDKTVEPEGFLADHFTLYNDSLYYTIHFQNTGNDTAFSVIVTDSLDASLDINTFHVTGSSHPVQTTIHSNRVVEFNFENILLPDSGIDLIGSNGFVQFRIQAIGSLALPVVLNNNADIYFDQNPAVRTNTVSNTLVLDPYVGLPRENYSDADVVVVPNPFSNEAEIQLSGIFENQKIRLRIMNAWGMLVADKTFTGRSEKIYRENLSPGIYFYQVDGDKGIRNSGKLIIQ